MGMMLSNFSRSQVQETQKMWVGGANNEVLLEYVNNLGLKKFGTTKKFLYGPMKFVLI